MALKRPQWDGGSLIVLEHQSKVLRDNPLGDPSLRKLGNPVMGYGLGTAIFIYGQVVDLDKAIFR